jgi:cytochrome c peroxidase
MEYQDAFKNAFPEYKQNSLNSQTIQYAISSYVSSLSALNSPFDKYVRGESKQIPTNIKNGFNLFMGKAACGTCHFAPTFNGTVPPLYLESESEVLGVPENPYIKLLKLDPDRGRAIATMREGTPFYEHSFKTPTVRNVSFTAPYMHNGAYKTLDDVMDFYNNGGGKGMGLEVPYQTLSKDSLHLNKQETSDIIAFMQSLADTIGLTSVPKRLPVFEGNEVLNKRKVGGEY